MSAVSTSSTGVSSISERYIEQVEEFGAHNYHPLEVVVATGFG